MGRSPVFLSSSFCSSFSFLFFFFFSFFALDSHPLLTHYLMDAIFSQLTQPAAQEEDPSQIYGWGQLKGYGRTSRLLLTEANREYWIGRHTSCNLVLSNVQVSNRHCFITRLEQREGEGGKGREELPQQKIATQAITSPSRNHDRGGGAGGAEGGGGGRNSPQSPSHAHPSARPAAAYADSIKMLDRHPSADKALVVITDTSSNGTYVNGKLVGKGKNVPLKHKDVISLSTKNANTASPDLCKSPVRSTPQTSTTLLTPVK